MEDVCIVSKYPVLEPEVSTGQDFLSCPASSLRPGGRQDRTKTKNASCPTGQDRTGQDRAGHQDTRTACPVLSSDLNTCISKTIRVRIDHILSQGTLEDNKTIRKIPHKE